MNIQIIFFTKKKHYWSFFRNDIGLNHNEIQELTKALIGIHLNCKHHSREFIPTVMRLNSIWIS